MRPSRQTRKFGNIIDYEVEKEGLSGNDRRTIVLNNFKDAYLPSCPDFTDEECSILFGRYKNSHIRYDNEEQFWIGFFTISLEGLPRLRAKLKANQAMRNLTPEEALEGEVYETTRREEESNIDNVAQNPDTEPADDTMEPLPYINQQTHGKAEDTITNTEKRTLGKVSGLYFFKHSLGSQAYNEWLDSYRDLFIKILTDEEEEIFDTSKI